MKSSPQASCSHPDTASITDFLILSDGTVLAHNLTPAMAAVLNELNPQDESLRARAAAGRHRPPASPRRSRKPRPSQPGPAAGRL